MSNVSRLTLFTLGAAFLVAACESPTPASTGPEAPGISQAIHIDVAGDGGAAAEGLEVCKSWESPSATITDFLVTIDDGRTGGTVTSEDRTLADGACRDWAQFDGRAAGAGPADALTVTETVPGGSQLVDITWVAVNQAGADITAQAEIDYGVNVDLATATWSAGGAAQIDNDVGFLVTFHNRLVPTGGEGCTPGFWKNRGLRLGWPAPYGPGDSYDTVFGVMSDFGGTLLDAVRRGGGGEIALGRHAVAALLNAASSNVEFDLTEAEVIALVQAAYASGDFEDAKDELEPFNEQNAAGFCE